MVVSVADIEKPVHERRVWRFLTEAERWTLIGHKPEYSTCTGKTAGRKLTGNSFPVPMLAAVVIPMLEAVAQSRVLSPEGIKCLKEEELRKLSPLASQVVLKSEPQREATPPRADAGEDRDVRATPEKCRRIDGGAELSPVRPVV